VIGAEKMYSKSSYNL